MATDFDGRLHCVPGLVVVSRDTSAPPYVQYRLTVEQPVDHLNPAAGTFKQRLQLWHVAEDRPVVLATSGYGLSTRRGELARTFQANQVNYEHRYFASSRPVPTDWTKLDIRQAAGDAHHIVESLRWLYTGRWVNTGASKGGMTSVYHRRFHACDVDATVAYVAPVSLGTADPSYVPFLDAVGGAASGGCRDELKAFQRRLLEQRDRLAPMVAGTFTRLPRDQVYEMAVTELYFAFWQYTSPDDPTHGCAAIPAPGASDADMVAFLEYHSSSADLAGDASLEYYEPYYYQSQAQLGAPAPYEAHLKDLMRFPGTDVPVTYLRPTNVPTYDLNAMLDVNDWVKRDGERLMFIYGELDPWSSRIFELGHAKDSLVVFAPGGNHGSRLGLLATEDKKTALTTLERWLGVAVVMQPNLVAEPEPPPERWRR